MLLNLILLTMLFVAPSGAEEDASCISHETTYAFCIMNNTTDTSTTSETNDTNSTTQATIAAESILTIVSKTFTVEDLLDACQAHFLEDTLVKPICPEDAMTKQPPSPAQRFGFGFLAVLVISVLSLGGLLVFPFIYQIAFQYVLTTFTALAVGTLFGDTMFHLIPYALGLHSHSGASGHAHGSTEGSSSLVSIYQWRMLTAVMVLYAFFLLEVLIHWISHFRNGGNSVHSHSHAHSHTIQVNEKTKGDQMIDHTTVNIDENLAHDHHSHNHVHHHNYNERDPTLACATKNCVHHSHMHQESKEKNKSSGKQIEQDNGSRATRVTGWMIILGDGVHNFADGLAIGAAFNESLMLGLTTTFAIGCHELPHEFGDYAVLIKSGFSHCRALFWNFISATTAFVGFFVGATVSTNESVRQWIFAVTIGMFLYIALVDLLPTLLTDTNFKCRRFICVNIGFLIGIAIMFLLAIFEDKLIELGS
ncbi:unnamed protein product [Rotaria magnacalcarata]|uniref:Zinc transporter ZIP4 n=4 Tax=Rotaria magnacalcarata TaxID=392030 RepID=A0A816QFP6_9BILA|nr:unnamed protein product [Rotaria magnacalcarata]